MCHRPPADKPAGADRQRQQAVAGGRAGGCPPGDEDLPRDAGRAAARPYATKLTVEHTNKWGCALRRSPESRLAKVGRSTLEVHVAAHAAVAVAAGGGSLLLRLLGDHRL